jgi:hypothetical protein
MKSSLLLLLLWLISLSSVAQTSVGIFENHANIGQVLTAGTATYDKATQTYQLSGSKKMNCIFYTAKPLVIL